MPQKEYNRLFITRKYRENGITTQNRSQPCGLTNSKNWDPVQRVERKNIKKRRYFWAWKLNLTCVPLKESSI